VICVLLVCTGAWAETSLWEVRNSGAAIYLGGTCHRLRQGDYPLPMAFEKAYRGASIFI
jgi:uncharacterized protein YbaP (TraB family)